MASRNGVMHLIVHLATRRCSTLAPPTFEMKLSVESQPRKGTCRAPLSCHLDASYIYIYFHIYIFLYLVYVIYIFYRKLVIYFSFLGERKQFFLSALCYIQIYSYIHINIRTYITYTHVYEYICISRTEYL